MSRKAKREDGVSLHYVHEWDLNGRPVGRSEPTDTIEQVKLGDAAHRENVKLYFENENRKTVSVLMPTVTEVKKTRTNDRQSIIEIAIKKTDDPNNPRRVFQTLVLMASENNVKYWPLMGTKFEDGKNCIFWEKCGKSSNAEQSSDVEQRQSEDNALAQIRRLLKKIKCDKKQ